MTDNPQCQLCNAPTTTTDDGKVVYEGVLATMLKQLEAMGSPNEITITPQDGRFKGYSLIFKKVDNDEEASE